MVQKSYQNVIERTKELKEYGDGKLNNQVVTLIMPQSVFSFFLKGTTKRGGG